MNNDNEPSKNNFKPASCETNVRRCICPRCRKMDLTLTEMWKGHSVQFSYKNGVITNDKANEVGDPYKVRAYCNECGHEWNLKGVTQITDLHSGYIA